MEGLGSYGNVEPSPPGYHPKARGSEILGLGFYGLEFRDWVLGFRFRDWVLGFRV